MEGCVRTCDVLKYKRYLNRVVVIKNECFKVVKGMSYIIQSTEKLRSSGTENETKALFYMLGQRADSKEIYYFVVDVFNDLTGMTRQADKLWDLQSKGDKNPSPKTIGKELVTLFKNYMSSLEFEDYIIFLGGVSSTVRVDADKKIFGIENVKSKSLLKLKEGLKEEGKKKTYIAGESLTDESIDNFLRKVRFVVVDGEKQDYVKQIIRLSDKIVAKPEVLKSIFNEVRDMQDSKKNIGKIEGEKIESPEEVLTFGRHIRSSEIRLLILNRILNQEVINSRPPVSFLEIYNSYPEEKRKDLLEDCQHDLSRALFNSNEQEEFWRLLDNIYATILDNPNDGINELYSKMNKKVLNGCTDFNVLATKYFISIVKDGISNDN